MDDGIWRDPMDYDFYKDGPPYLPITASARRKVRVFAEKRAAYYDVPKVNDYEPMSFLLALLRAAAVIHQTAHWQTRGGHYYADHLLFQRIYEESGDGIDSIAERSVGLGGVSLVAAKPQAYLMNQVVSVMCPEAGAPDVESLVKISLDVESVVLKTISEVKASINESGALTEGLDDLLQGTASKHEEFVYLLQQRAGYTYDRR